MRDEFTYVTVWNGVNDGKNGDLMPSTRRLLEFLMRRDARKEGLTLAPPDQQVHAPVPEPAGLQIQPPKRTPAYLVNRNAVIVALRDASDPLTVLEIAAAAKVSEFTVYNVLRHLESKQLVTWSRKVGAYKRGVTIYRLAATVKAQGAA